MLWLLGKPPLAPGDPKTLILCVCDPKMSSWQASSYIYNIVMGVGRVTRLFNLLPYMVTLESIHGRHVPLNFLKRLLMVT
jgi:hypothetical protein